MNKAELTAWNKEQEAPPGAVWVCGACARYGKHRDRIGDESCFLNAILCKDDLPLNVVPSRWRWTAWNKDNPNEQD